MLDEAQKKALWDKIDRLERSEKEELRARLDASMSREPIDSDGIAGVFERMRRRSEGVTLGDDLTIRDLIDEGRRF